MFDRVLQRDLGFFEGNDGVPAGDIAHRITAEAADVADTLYALLNVSNQSLKISRFLLACKDVIMKVG